MATLNPYGKMNLVDQANLDARRRTMKRVAIIVFSTISLVAIVIAIAVVATRGKEPPSDNDSSGQSSGHPADIKALCEEAVYPDSCYGTLSNSTAEGFDPIRIYRYSLQIAMTEVSKASVRLDSLKSTMDRKYKPMLEACDELLTMSHDSINDSMTSTDLTSQKIVEDFRTWLSAALTYQDTCWEGFVNAPPEVKRQVLGILNNSTEFTSNSLSILTQVAKAMNKVDLRRRLLGYYADDGLPSWMSIKDRRLLQAPEDDLRDKADIVVDIEGSAKYKSISESLKAVPMKSQKRTVIYVKKGVYDEHVVVDKRRWNVLMVGDGGNETIVTGDRNSVDGVRTFKTGSLSALGKGFIAVSMGFRNTAGREKHQAVAFMSTSDKSAFYKCHFDAFQDTLYTHSMRQFYRECSIVGTIDFIFGNAAVVLQNCTVMPRVPMKNQKDTLTAQAKTDKNQNTGTSFHACKISQYGNLSDVEVYLGRPWRKYATVVWMKTYMPDIIQPKGWLPWDGDSGPKTIFYAEYNNTGPGADISGRVKWKGVHTAISEKKATSFTVGSFLGGDPWIPKHIPFQADL